MGKDLIWEESHLRWNKGEEGDRCRRRQNCRICCDPTPCLTSLNKTHTAEHTGHAGRSNTIARLLPPSCCVGRQPMLPDESLPHRGGTPLYLPEIRTSTLENKRTSTGNTLDSVFQWTLSCCKTTISQVKDTYGHDVGHLGNEGIFDGPQKGANCPGSRGTV